MKKFISLVTFERNGDVLQVLPSECHGACGWMAIEAPTEDRATEVLEHELADIGLRLIEVDEMRQVLSTEEVAEHDPHLAENMEQWESGKSTVWGTLHTYIGGGEA